MTGEIVAVKIGGYGFIKPDQDGTAEPKDIFFHANNLVDVVFDERLQSMRVAFDVVQGRKGALAKNVRPADA